MTDAALDHELSTPTSETIAAMRELDGDLLVLGAGGKMGPTLSRLAHRSLRDAGRENAVIAVSRFSSGGVREALERDGIRTLACDLLDRESVAALPDAPNVVLMAGQKFGTSADQSRTWAMNVLVPAIVAERYQRSRIVAFSTGNVYPLWPGDTDGPTEDDAVAPVGEYAQSALGRERILTHYAGRFGTPMALLRLNYSVEPRYGVLRDIADRVYSAQPVDLAMGAVNLIWQRDANAIALRSFAYCAAPPFVLNLTGPKQSVRDIAGRFAARWDRPATFTGREERTALLSNAARSNQLFGAPPTGLDAMVERVAGWVEAGGPSLGKPTHFEERAGQF